MNREDIYLKLAELHLKRVEVLQTVEWRITLSIWTFVASVTVVSLANADKLKQIDSIIAPGDVLSMMGVLYLMLWGLYAFGFSKENYNSLVTERNRYQRMQNEAIRATSGDRVSEFLIKSRSIGGEPSFEQLSGYDCIKSNVWLFKVLTTLVLMFFSWSLVAVVILSV
jgi:hypothetical protein